jgi:hypothetical protein
MTGIITQEQANEILSLLYELPFKYAQGTIQPIQTIILGVFKREEEKRQELEIDWDKVKTALGNTD